MNTQSLKNEEVTHFNLRFPYSYQLDENCIGFADKVDNCWNFSIISISSKDVWENEYRAGFIQGKLQGVNMIKAARNNTWKNTYLCDPAHTYPRNIPPMKQELEKAGGCLRANLDYTLHWIENNPDNKCAVAIKRLLYRMWGIYDGLVYNEPLKLSQVHSRIGDSTLQLYLSYGEADINFLDIYFLNAQLDMFDVISNSLELSFGLSKSDHCSAFVKRTDTDIYWTHNSWCGFLSQSHTITYTIGNSKNSGDPKQDIDFITQNSYCPGQWGSNMDFGFNGHGICFNETTHRYSKNRSKEKGIWLCWRAAAAEMFATSIDEFYEYISVDNTGTYLNGYMVIDVNTNETALIEMSYERFVMFRTKDGKNLTVKDSTGVPVTDKDYDTELITPEYILGVNYPVSKTIVHDLQSTDNRPMRRKQFNAHIQEIDSLDAAKDLITYVTDQEPLSIYGRWDLGYGTTQYPKTIPDGAVDAKAFSANEVRRVIEKLSFVPDETGQSVSFWMLYGTPEINGEPFIWSASQWKDYKEKEEIDFVPDRLEGNWQKVKLFLKFK